MRGKVNLSGMPAHAAQLNAGVDVLSMVYRKCLLTPMPDRETSVRLLCQQGIHMSAICQPCTSVYSLTAYTRSRFYCCVGLKWRVPWCWQSA